MPKLYTVGHSNHSLEEFIALLKAHDIKRIIDIRTIPKSRKFPWFNKDHLKQVLQQEKINYLHLEELGGLRHAEKNSINQGWHNASFRGYADYMQTPAFFSALKKLNSLIKGKGNKKSAIMCAEVLPWRCHRSLVADAETIRGINVEHIMSLSATRRHHLTAFAVVNRNKRPMQIYYPTDMQTKPVRPLNSP